MGYDITKKLLLLLEYRTSQNYRRPFVLLIFIQEYSGNKNLINFIFRTKYSKNVKMREILCVWPNGFMQRQGFGRFDPK